MITIEVPSTIGIITDRAARKFLREHVIVSVRDLRRISALAKKRGFYKELKALSVLMHELAPREGEGSWK